MSYLPDANPDMSMFDNVFVSPEAHQASLTTGTWPDRTVMVLETRGAESSSSIKKAGHFQIGAVMELEVHVKDETRSPGKWDLFDVANESKATLIPQSAPCYSCHAEHAAVDTSFLQFYPTLLPIAQKRLGARLAPAISKTLRPSPENKAGGRCGYCSLVRLRDLQPRNLSALSGPAERP
jgi:hypothetical protein